MKLILELKEIKQLLQIIIKNQEQIIKNNNAVSSSTNINSYKCNVSSINQF